MTYRPTANEGTGVDTITAQYIVPRKEADPVLDVRADMRRRSALQRPPSFF